LLVLPGIIDAHVHLRDQEQAYKEDFFSGTAAAANGGVTCVLDMPNNKPVTMDVSTLRERMSIAAKKVIVNVGFLSAFPTDIKEIRNIVREGIKAFKLYMSQKIGGIDPDDDEALTKALIETRKMSIPVCIHAEDRQLIESAYSEMKEKKESRVWSFIFGMFIGWAVMSMVFLSTPYPPKTECNSQNYNEYTGYEMCQRNCEKYNSTALHTFSYIDNRWHCSCNSGNETALLW
jgi:hypothetical protein